MEDLNRKAEETAAEVQRLTNEKNEKMSKIKQHEEKLVVCNQHKAFLDMLAVSAGKKLDRRPLKGQQHKQHDAMGEGQRT
jgi:hypothetical protein